ncbi:alpha/beta hydrolase [Streptomyces sp. E5N91]|uniref:alpha/beta fold hydrolase n=1 Tax=Streptomyces sp. E5N91 TaxID=1851996 RepID=UPI000EF55EAF|nr:alpha/beta hydrolase [Streptomyces sp. E5N91]
MLAYDVRGRGPGLVLLHGIGSTATETWGPVADRLATEYAVVLPDLPGSGRTPLPDGRPALSEVADQVVAAAREAGLDDFVIAGASLGAAVAVRAAARRPDLVRGLFTLSGFVRPRAALWLHLEMWAARVARRDPTLDTHLTPLSFSEKYLSALTEQGARQQAARFAASAPGVREQIALALDVDLCGDLPAVTVPTLVVAAMADRLVDPEHSVELAERIPDARLTAVGAGHAAAVEEPGRVLEILTEFLREVNLRASTPPGHRSTAVRQPAPTPAPRRPSRVPRPRSPR